MKGPRRVLVVDDSPTLREFLANTLASFGYTVVGRAADGREAVEAFERTRPDAVLLDIGMPGFDGYYALERLLAIDPQCVVIMLTASEEPEALERCSQMGARGFLRKPFVVDRLDQELRLLLSVAKATEARAELSQEYVDYWVKPQVSLPDKIKR